MNRARENRLFHPLATALGLRYIRAKRSNHFISFISVASVAGIALGVLVLITVLSVINGFEEGMRKRILGVLSHVTVSETDASVANWQQRREEILGFDHVVAAAPFVEKQVMLNESGEVEGVMLEGVLPEYEQEIGNLSEHIQAPAQFDDLKAGEYRIILGATLAKNLDVETGDSLTLLSPKIIQGQQQALPLLREFTVAGIFRVDMQQYDSATAYVHMQDAMEMFNLGDEVTGLRVQLDDLFKAPLVSVDIAAKSSGDFWVSDWTRQNENFFKAIQLQKSMLFLVLALIIAVAAFNLISTLVMVVADKSGDIAILRTLGMPPKQVMNTFIIQGSILGAIGTLTGVVLGLLLAYNVSHIVPWIESLLDHNLISPDVYGITQIEAKIEFFDVIFVALAALLLSVIATIYPARKAAKLAPAEALRYE